MEGLIDNPLGPLLLRPNSPPGFLSQPGVCLAIVNGRFARRPARCNCCCSRSGINGSTLLAVFQVIRRLALAETKNPTHIADFGY